MVSPVPAVRRFFGTVTWIPLVSAATPAGLPKK